MFVFAGTARAGDDGGTRAGERARGADHGAATLVGPSRPHSRWRQPDPHGSAAGAEGKPGTLDPLFATRVARPVTHSCEPAPDDCSWSAPLIVLGFPRHGCALAFISTSGTLFPSCCDSSPCQNRDVRCYQQTAYHVQPPSHLQPAPNSHTSPASEMHEPSPLNTVAVAHAAALGLQSNCQHFECILVVVVAGSGARQQQSQQPRRRIERPDSSGGTTLGPPPTCAQHRQECRIASVTYLPFAEHHSVGRVPV